MYYLLLLIGFVFLIKGADLFVDGSSSIATILKVPSVIIGLTIVAMGTSAPEAAVSITASLNGNNEIAIGNILGSNIFNLLFVVGICAVIRPFFADKSILKRDFPISIFSALLLLVFCIDNKLSRIEGIIFLVLMSIYVFAMIFVALKNRTASKNRNILSPLKSILFIIIGLIAIITGGNLVVDNASLIAESFGISKNLIGLTIVAVGTSLPELVTSVVAAKKGESGLALGNAIGSNIFNILFILGISSTLTPIVVEIKSIYDAIVLVIVSTVFLISIFITKNKIPRYSGVVSVIIYIIYTIYIIIR